jgi:4-amino-4-deoxy-L-arabinose transferase-like glycosyltransferase
MATNKSIWAGRVLTTLAVLPFVMSVSMKFSRSAQMMEGWTHFGWQESSITTIAVLELLSVVLYLIPQISVLGAIVLTGYLGGAIATHVRVGEAVYIHVAIGLLIWGGLYLREPRLRAILPIRK